MSTRRNANAVLPETIFRHRINEIRDYIGDLFPEDASDTMSLNRIATVLNKHGFKDSKGRPITIDRLKRDTSAEVIRWLENILINEEEAAHMMNVLQPEPAPERLTSEQRQTRRYMTDEEEQMNILMKDTEAEPAPVIMTPSERLDRYLYSGLRDLNRMLNDVENGMNDVHLDLSRSVNLNWLIITRLESGLNTNFKELNQRLIEWFENLASKLAVDKPYLYMYSTLDEKGHEQWKNVYLTPYNLKVIIDDLKDHGICDIKDDKESFNNPYEDEMAALPSMSIINKFTVCPFEARYGAINNLDAVMASAENHKIKRNYVNRENAFLPYYADDKLPPLLLEYLEQRLQIISRKSDKALLNDCCAIFALRNAGVEEYTLNLIKGTRLVNDRNLKFGDLIKVCDEFNLNVSIRDCNAETTGHKNQVRMSTKCKEGNPIVLCAYKGHYFLEEITPFSLDNIRRLEITEDNLGKRYRNEKWVHDKSRKNLISYDLVKMLFDKNAFQQMSFQDMMKYPQVVNTISNDNLEIRKTGQTFKGCFKSADELGLGKHIDDDDDDDENDDTKEKVIWYADFETDTHKRGDVNNKLYTNAHEPYLVCLHSQDGKIQKEFEGTDCGKQLLDFIPDNSLVLFHNLKYDICFIAKYFQKIYKNITRGKCVMVWSGYYNKKYVELKDSASLITAPLAKFPKMFKLASGVKEVFPYDFYTVERYTNGIGDIKEATEYLKSDDVNQFIKNIDEVVKCRIDGDKFDLKKYARFYCHQDVRILREGFNKFQQMINDDFEIDVFTVCSASSLAYKVFLKNVLLFDSRIKATSGFVDQYIRGALVGGRCMVRDNKAFHTKIPLVDFDARSLYPSAMNILDIPLGEAKGFIGDIPKKATYYICDILIHKIENPRHFPLVRIDGQWCDTFEERTIRVDKRTLEDLDQFYDIDYEVKQGIYWNQGTTPALKKFIQRLYDRRRELKEQGNPLQEVYKLILNSCYGKMIQKPYPTKKVVKSNKDAGSFLLKNANWIVNQYDISDSDLTVFEQRKSIRYDYSFSLIGEMVLSHSKHIMNEVMCLAEDLEIPIFYQDTDSMHLPKELLPQLREKFNEKYNRELVGSALGQFHSDFNDSDTAYAVESYFIGKKIYLDVLDDETLHIRLKGISNDAIKEKGDVKELYKRLFETNDEIAFNLADHAKFEIEKEFAIFTRDEFIRRIKCLVPMNQRYTLNTLEEAQELNYN